MTVFWSFFSKHGVLGQVLGTGIFVLYFFPVMAWFVSHSILWGIHSMVFGSSSNSPTAHAWGNIPFFGSLAVGIVAAVFWTFGLLRIFF
jgi:hypothetical protein